LYSRCSRTGQSTAAQIPAARHQSHFEHGVATTGGKCAVVRDRLLSFARTLHVKGTILCQVRAKSAGRLRKPAVDDGDIDSLDVMCREERLQSLAHVGVFGEHEDSGAVAVETVNDMHAVGA